MTVYIEVNRLRNVLTTTLIVLMSILLFAEPASAHAFGLRKSDNSTLTFSSDEDWDHDWSYWNHFVHFELMNEYDRRTDLRTEEQERRRHNGDTDVIWIADKLGSGVNADYTCTKINFSNGRCNQGRLRFNEAYTNRVPQNTGWYLSCHEFGHHLGLDHLDDSQAGCMTTRLDPWNPPSSGGSLNDHMIKHLNSQY